MAGRSLAGTFAAVWQRLRGSTAPLDARLQVLPEVAAVYELGYTIESCPSRPARRYQRWTFRARFRGRRIGCLEVDLLAASRWLYVQNVYVDDAHGRTGVGTALLLAAVKATACAGVITSKRTAQGLCFFERSRALLQRHGIELRDHLP